MPPIVLKIEGNESFLPFSNLDQDELSKTWRVCTKVKDSLENGSRLENLSWRLWFIQNVLVSNDVKSNHKYQKWSKKTTQQMEIEKELEPTKPLKQQPNVDETPASVLDYSLDEIKPVATENFILNQFTSDQEGDLMIELKDIFPFGMQDFMDTNASATATISNEKQQQQQQQADTAMNASSWLPNNEMYNVNNYPAANSMPYSSTPAVSQSLNNNNYANSNLFMDPISGIHSLFADHIEIPSLTMPADVNTNMSNFQQMQPQPSTQQLYQQQPQQDLVVDFNNAAYVAAAAAATAAALTTLPNATLHNKLLATLPPQTLASAERLLSPAKRRPTAMAPSAPPQQQQQQLQMPHTSSPLSFIPNKSNKFVKPASATSNTMNSSPQHYYNTFQLNPCYNSLSSTSASAPAKKKSHSSTSTSTTTSSSPSSSSAMTEEKPPVCSNCDATSTPLWRRSADDKVLCNACGLYLKLHNAPRPKHLKPITGGKKHESNGSMEDVATEDQKDYTEKQASQQQQQQQTSSTESHTVCSNCGTIKTPLWRRDIEGAPLCNACGLYLKLHNEKRPLSMKTDVIKKRQRTEALIASTISDDQLKKPRYYDQQTLYSSEHGSTSGYRHAASSLPGTGILMMTTNNSGSNSSGSQKS
ncbi:hypothetical protein PS15p_204095 [Mucor circinelloides]